MKKIPPEVSATALRKSIDLLNEEWRFYQTTGQCPKCKSKMLGATLVYDDVCDKANMIHCTICGKDIYSQGGMHLEEILRGTIFVGNYGPRERTPPLPSCSF